MMSEINPIEGEWYLVHCVVTDKWHVLQYNVFNDGKYVHYDNGHFYIHVKDIDKVFPLSLAIAAPEMLAALKEIANISISNRESKESIYAFALRKVHDIAIRAAGGDDE